MASTLKINNLDTASGTTITIPTGKTLQSTDTPFIGAGNVIQVKQTYYQTQVIYNTNNAFNNTGPILTFSLSYRVF